jgi:hypothetical protein
MSNLAVILLVVVLLLGFGGLPRWGYHRYGYVPSGTLGTVLLVLLILAVMGRI